MPSLRAWFPDDAACLDYLDWLRRLGSCQTAWRIRHRYRSAMIRPGRGKLRTEVDVRSVPP